MTRSIVLGLLGLISVVAFTTFPTACQSGGVGDPCVPEDEYSPDFAGFKMTEENIESRSFQCATRICLVNHFQGRVSCPAGQASLRACDPDADASDANVGCQPVTADGMTDYGKCVESTTFIRECADDAPCGTVPGADKCDTKQKLCGCQSCASDGDCGEGHACNLASKLCVLKLDPTTNKVQEPLKGYICKDGLLKSFNCHKENNCQDASLTADKNLNKDCCVPGTDKPVSASVCGQCDEKESKRSAKQAVYCSCRCGVADGEPDDGNFNFCACPTGFTCSEIRPNIGLGDQQITGKYCIKNETEFNGDVLSCRSVTGYWDATCNGTPVIQ